MKSDRPQVKKPAWGLSDPKWKMTKMINPLFLRILKNGQRDLIENFVCYPFVSTFNFVCTSKSSKIRYFVNFRHNTKINPL